MQPAIAPTATAVLHGRDRGRAHAGRLVHPHADARHGGDDGERAGRRKSRARCVIELLVADQPAPRRGAHDRPPIVGLGDAPWASPRFSRYPRRWRRNAGCWTISATPPWRVNLDACIHCNLCVRACREVQVNDVIGMAGSRARDAKIVFDFRRPDGRVDLRGLRRMRPGLPDRRADAGDRARR